MQSADERLRDVDQQAHLPTVSSVLPPPPVHFRTARTERAHWFQDFPRGPMDGRVVCSTSIGSVSHTSQVRRLQRILTINLSIVLGAARVPTRVVVFACSRGATPLPKSTSESCKPVSPPFLRALAQAAGAIRRCGSQAPAIRLTKRPLMRPRHASKNTTDEGQALLLSPVFPHLR